MKFTFSTMCLSVWVFMFVNDYPLQAGNHTRTSTITVTSHHGHGTIRVPIRKRSLGWQARLPRGTWIWCEGDCDEAVRYQYLDFWERQRELTAHIGP